LYNIFSDVPNFCLDVCVSKSTSWVEMAWLEKDTKSILKAGLFSTFHWLCMLRGQFWEPIFWQVGHCVIGQVLSFCFFICMFGTGKGFVMFNFYDSAKHCLLYHT